MATEHSNTPADQKQTTEIHPLQPNLVVQIYGEFPKDLSEGYFEGLEYLVLTFSPSSLPLKKRWRTNGLSADFLADYLTTFLPGDEDAPETIAKRTEIQSAVSYIANELLENAMKFSPLHSPQPVNIHLQWSIEHLTFWVTNSVDTIGTQRYQSFIQELLASDPGDMLIQRLENNAETDTPQTSGLGLLTILNDYLAQLSWKFEAVPQNRTITIVTTAVQISF